MKKARNYVHNLTAYVLYLLAQILVLLYYNQQYGLHIAGLYTLSISVISPVFMFTNFQLKVVVATERSERYRFFDFFIFRVYSSVAAVLLLGMYSFYGSHGSDHQLLFLVMVACKFFEMLSDIIYGDLQRAGRFHTANYLISAKSILYCCIIPVDYFLLHDYHAMMLMLLLVFVFFFGLEYWRFVYRNGFVLRYMWTAPHRISAILKQNWQLGFVSYCNSLKVNIPRYFIAQASMSALSVFSTLSYLNYGMNLLFGALGEVSNVAVAQKPSLVKKTLVSFILIAFVYTLAIWIGISFFEDLVLQLAFGKLVAIPPSLILFILVNGFFVNALQIIQNYFLVFRLNGTLMFLNVLEILALLGSFYWLGGQDANSYLNLQALVAFGFGLLSMRLLYLGAQKWLQPANAPDHLLADASGTRVL